MKELCVQIVYSLLPENAATIHAEVGMITIIFVCDMFSQILFGIMYFMDIVLCPMLK